MYLTEGWLNVDTALRRGLFDSYDWHRKVWEAFPGHERDRRAFLMRIDPMRDRFRLYIVSEWAPVRPDWWPKGEDSWRTKAIPESFFSYRRYAFQLCANPTKKVAKVDERGNRMKNGRREPLRTREDLEAWIVRKGQEGGFRPLLETLRILPMGRRYFKRGNNAGMHSAVDYRGILEVTDGARFRDTFRRGIGPAKGFGFGLLLLAPIGRRHSEGQGQEQKV